MRMRSAVRFVLQRWCEESPRGNGAKLSSSVCTQCTCQQSLSPFVYIYQAGAEVSPSTLFAVASILEGCAYINGSPQNTFVPGAIELAMQNGVFIGGDDLKSGQTKIKSVLVDFLVSAGIKVRKTDMVIIQEKLWTLMAIQVWAESNQNKQNIAVCQLTLFTEP